MKLIEGPRSIIVLTVLIMLLCSGKAFAYIDAGTSGLVFQLGYLFFILFFSTIAFIPKKIYGAARGIIRKVFRFKNDQND